MEETAGTKPCPEPEPEIKKQPVINCHTHTFTAGHVPPWLAKTVVPKPFCYLLHLGLIVSLFRFWYKYPARIPYTPLYKRLSQWYASFQAAFNKLGFIRVVIEYYVTVQVFFILYAILRPVFPPEKTWLSEKINAAGTWLSDKGLLWHLSPWLYWPLLILVFIFFPSGKNLLLFIAKQLWAMLRKIPGKQTKEVLKRYLNIGRFAFHKRQEVTLRQLSNQYPAGSEIVILPMDMSYMKAGSPSLSYEEQMEELAVIKAKNSHVHPFVFADPRRMEKDPAYFSYSVADGKVILNDCFIKKYIAGHTVKYDDDKEPATVKFSGFKIYPALGYYPFDPLLLPLWKYAADNGLPILTHCVRGPMYYRGSKKTAWNHHPVFKQANGKEDKRTDMNGEEIEKPETIYGPLSLPELKNDVFSSNFTHPMNFLCLLKKEFLAHAVQIAFEKGDQQTKTNLTELFGFTPRKGKIDPVVTNGLDHLKICLGHFGGNDEWRRYFDKDRYGFSNELARNPETGIDFLYLKNKSERSFGKPEQLWKYTDWYSIICSMMLQHDNVYADISYILHSDAEILPLLKQTLQNKKLRPKVLYGTDFYVVRNHKSDKNMLADMMGGLSEEDFDQIARCNPRKFLNL